MSGIRLQPGAPRHYGGSNRTIIKQAYEMLLSDRTAFAAKKIGALVTLDKVFELVEGITKVPAFRSSLFSPRQSVGLKTLTQAVQQLEDLTGEEVDVEEGAIATAFKKVAAAALNPNGCSQN